MLSYKYQLREANLNLDQTNNDIGTLKEAIANYKDDEVVISSQDYLTSQTAKVTSDYYNNLVNQLTNLNDFYDEKVQSQNKFYQSQE